MLPLVRGDVEILYILYFMLPRFLNRTPREKLETVIHELYHISPFFNGDLRRFKGRSVLHGSHKAYDSKVKALTDEFLASTHDVSTYAFLSERFDLTQWKTCHIPEPRPKLLKVAWKPARPI